MEFVVLSGPGLRLGFSTSFGPKSGYRKYPHLLKNPNVAVTFTSEVQNITFQCEGVVKENSAQPDGEVRKVLFEKFPDSSGFLAQPEAKFFVVTLEWGRYSDFADNRPENFFIRELNF